MNTDRSAYLYLFLSVPLVILSAGCGGRSSTTPEDTRSIAADSGAAPAFTDGLQEIMGKDGNLLMKGELRGGKRHGPWASFFPNGMVRSRATYEQGLQVGATEVFHENGSIYYTGQYHLDKPVGEWLFHDPEGTLVKTVEYDSAGVILKQEDILDR
jgi:hypothetical protein